MTNRQLFMASNTWFFDQAWVMTFLEDVYIEDREVDPDCYLIQTGDHHFDLYNDNDNDIRSKVCYMPLIYKGIVVRSVNND